MKTQYKILFGLFTTLLLAILVTGLGDTFIFQTNNGNITLNSSILDGTYINCSDIIFDTGAGAAGICDGVDASAAGGGNTSQEMIDAVNASEYYHYQFRVNCSSVYFDNGLGSAGICDGVDSAAGSGGVNMWVDNGSFLSPNSSYATNVYADLFFSPDWSNITITESQISDLQSYLLTVPSVNITTNHGGEVTGTYDNLVIGNDVLDDQYYDSESDLTTLLDDNYLSTVPSVNLTTNHGGEVSGTYDNIVLDNDALDDQYYDSEADLTGLLDDNYVSRNAWTDIDNYPASCAADYYVQGIGDTLDCVHIVNDTDTFNTSEQMVAAVNTSSMYQILIDWINILNLPTWNNISSIPSVNITTNHGGEVTGTYNAMVIDNDALDDQYFDEVGDLTALLDAVYEEEAHCDEHDGAYLSCNGEELDVDANGICTYCGLDQESIEDYVGAMVSGNTETDIAVTYEDGDGTLDFVVNANLIETNDAATLTTLDTGQGAYELYAMNQDVETTDDVTFNNVTLEAIYLEKDTTNHKIYDNTTCVIIKGDTSTLTIC